MALIAIAAALSAPRMASFFRGRALDQEARRLLALTRYAQSRAANEGVPVLLWVDRASASYGLEIQPGFGTGDDPRAVTYELDRDITLETAASTQPEPYEDEGVASPGGPPREGLLFLPDGLLDLTSLSKIVLRQGEEGAVALMPTSNGLGFELRTDHESTRR